MRSRGLAAIGLVMVLAAGCSSGTPAASSAPATSSTAGGGASTQTASQVGGDSGGATAAVNPGGNASTIDACKLLTADEIKGATGITVTTGVLQTTDTQADCEWDSADGATSVGLTVATFDDTLWSTLSTSADAKPVSGLGEAAYSGVPHFGDLAVKVKGYEVDVAIVDFQTQASKLVGEDEALAQIVLPRL
jgi:hypothetical protein